MHTRSEREFFALIGKRPGMYVSNGSFHGLATYLTGYDAHAARHGGPGLTGWREWLVDRRGRECGHAWPGLVLHIALPEGWTRLDDLPPEAEDRAVRTLFQLLDEFLAERENRGGRAGGPSET